MGALRRCECGLSVHGSLQNGRMHPGQTPRTPSTTLRGAPPALNFKPLRSEERSFYKKPSRAALNCCYAAPWKRPEGIELNVVDEKVTVEVGEVSMSSGSPKKVVFSNIRAMRAVSGRQLGVLERKSCIRHDKRATGASTSGKSDKRRGFAGSRGRLGRAMAVGICERAATEQQLDAEATTRLLSHQANLTGADAAPAINWLNGTETKPQDDNGEASTPTAAVRNCITTALHQQRKA